eukprot:5429684-Amphidinium_carterae.1
MAECSCSHPVTEKTHDKASQRGFFKRSHPAGCACGLAAQRISRSRPEGLLSDFVDHETYDGHL